MDDDLSKLSDVGEDELITRLAGYFGIPPDGEVWSGDDAAVVMLGDSPLLLATDALVEGVDFDFSLSTGFDLGWKAIAVNVSDIAAMGGRPAHAVVTLGAPASTSLKLTEELARGISEAAKRWQVSVVGGDFSSAQALFINVAITGTLIRERPVLRSGASVGDALCVTGRLGGSAGGLLALKGALHEEEGDGALQALVERHRRPEARVAEANVITDLGPTAMIDISDGLGRDLARLVEASGVGCEVDAGAIPVEPGLEVLATRVPGLDPFEIAVTGGEDYELLFSLDPSCVDEMLMRTADLGAPAVQIGSITSGARNLGDGPLDVWKDKGWDHLASR